MGVLGNEEWVIGLREGLEGVDELMDLENE